MLAAMVMTIAPVWAVAAPPPGAASCLGCHAAAGRDSPVVSLASLKAEQIETAMQAFRTGTRPATVMDRLAKGFSDEEIRAIAQWYAGARPK
jgi:sulfide dehydrogenase cytochrome subunit